MSPFAVVFLCIQACLIQSAFSQCTSHAVADISAPYRLAAPALAAPCGLTAPFGLHASGLAAPFGSGYHRLAHIPAAGYGVGLAPYGGAGEGNLAVTGELPVVGTTIVTGQVPIMGAVKFSGPVPASGSVIISGKCACGCKH